MTSTVELIKSVGAATSVFVQVDKIIERTDWTTGL